MRLTGMMLAALLLVAGCGNDGGGQSEGGDIPEGAAANEAPLEGDASPMGWDREYEKPEDIIDELNAAGVQCETEEPSAPTMISLRGQFCYVNETRDEGYHVDVYGSGEQQGAAHVHFSEDTSWAGTTFVWGTGWSVAVPFDSDGSEVVDAIGGEVDPG